MPMCDALYGFASDRLSSSAGLGGVRWLLLMTSIPCTYPFLFLKKQCSAVAITTCQPFFAYACTMAATAAKVRKTTAIHVSMMESSFKFVLRFKFEIIRLQLHNLRRHDHEPKIAMKHSKINPGQAMRKSQAAAPRTAISHEPLTNQF